MYINRCHILPVFKIAQTLGSKQSKKQGDNHSYDSQQNIVTSSKGDNE